MLPMLPMLLLRTSDHARTNDRPETAAVALQLVLVAVVPRWVVAHRVLMSLVSNDDCRRQLERLAEIASAWWWWWWWPMVDRM